MLPAGSITDQARQTADRGILPYRSSARPHGLITKHLIAKHLATGRRIIGHYRRRLPTIRLAYSIFVQ